MTHDEGKICRCVKKHVPQPAELELHHVWPIYLGGPKNGWQIWLCPTTHMNVHELIRLKVKTLDKIEAIDMREYNRYTKQLAQEAYEKWAEHALAERRKNG